MLNFESAPNPDQLVEKLGLELHTYIAWGNGRSARFTVDTENFEYILKEIIPYQRIPYGVDLKHGVLGDQLEQPRWHLQIYRRKKPNGIAEPAYYAHATFKDENWIVDRIGEEVWLTTEIARGITHLALQENVPFVVDDVHVDLVSSRLFGFSSFRIHGDKDLHHLITSVHPKLEGKLEQFTWWTDKDLTERLVEIHGPDYASGGFLVEA